MTENDIAFVAEYTPFHPFGPQTGQNLVWLTEVPCITRYHFEATKARFIAHANFTIKCIFLFLFAFEMLTKSLSICHVMAHQHWEEFYQPGSTMTVLSWRHGFLFMTNC